MRCSFIPGMLDWREADRARNAIRRNPSVNAGSNEAQIGRKLGARLVARKTGTLFRTVRLSRNVGKKNEAAAVC